MYVKLQGQKHKWRYFLQVCRIIVFGVFFGPGGLSYVQIGPGIQNFKKILPAYVRTRVYATPCYEQAYLAISLQQKEQCMRLNHSFHMGLPGGTQNLGQAK